MTPFRKSRKGEEPLAGTGGWADALPPSPVRLRRKTNRHAIASLLTGLFGLSVIAMGFGISALAQLRGSRLERGRPLAYIGLVTGAGWLVVTVVAVAQVMPSHAPKNVLFHAPKNPLLVAQDYPKPGECFDYFQDRRHKKRDCAQPHDAEMVLTFKLPGKEWTDEKEIVQLGIDGCRKRVMAQYRTRMPIENGEAWVLYPDRRVWAADPSIACAIAAQEGYKLKAAIGPAPSQIRLVEELQPGDCFVEPRRDSATTTLAACNMDHDAQLTHRFELPDGPYAGEDKTKKRAEDGCTTRQDRLFAKERSPLPIERWFVSPTNETWGDGDRLVLCYVIGKGGRDLGRSVIPD